MSEIQRLDIICPSWGGGWDTEKKADGDFMRSEDVNAHLAALSAARASDAETIKNQGLHIATLRGLLVRAVNAMGMHGPCTNHSCRECSATFTDIRAALRTDPYALSPLSPPVPELEWRMSHGDLNSGIYRVVLFGQKYQPYESGFMMTEQPLPTLRQAMRLCEEHAAKAKGGA